MATNRIRTNCRSCHSVGLHRARGLCEPCYYRHLSNGTLDDFERRNYPREELLSEWEWLSSHGYTRAQAADRLGIDKKRLEKAIERSRKVA